MLLWSVQLLVSPGVHCVIRSLYKRHVVVADVICQNSTNWFGDCTQTTFQCLVVDKFKDVDLEVLVFVFARIKL